MQPRSRSCGSAPTALPPSRWNSLAAAAAAQPAEPAAFLPRRAPSKPRTSEGGAGRGRLAGPARAGRPARPPPPPARSPVAKAAPSPASLPFSRPYPGGPACEDPAARPQPLPLLTTGGGGGRGSPAGGEGRGEAGPAQPALRGPT